MASSRTSVRRGLSFFSPSGKGKVVMQSFWRYPLSPRGIKLGSTVFYMYMMYTPIDSFLKALPWSIWGDLDDLKKSHKMNTFS